MTARTSLRYAQTTDGVDIAYAVLGRGEPVVMTGSIGSAGIDASLTSEVILRRYQRLASHRSVVLFDWRNMGASGSSTAPLSMDTFLADLSAVVDTVGGSQIDLIGQMTAAHVAIEYAAAHPTRVRRLALIGYLPTGGTFSTNPAQAHLWPLVASNWDAYARNLAVTIHGLVDAELARTVYGRLLTRFDAESWQQMENAISAFNTKDKGTELSMPVFLFQRPDLTKKALAEVRRFAASIPNAQVAIAGDSFQDFIGAALNEVTAFLGAAGPGDRRSEPNVQTILFTDLAGSTSTQNRLGDAAARSILGAHDVVVRRSVERHGGREVKHTGDGIMAAFGSAAGAVNCALDIRRDIATFNAAHEGEELRVRFGLNTGEPIAEDDDLFGLSVTLAARIGNWGEPGQVLCSNVVRELLLGKGFTFQPVGEAALKGFADPVVLFEVQPDSRATVNP